MNNGRGYDREDEARKHERTEYDKRLEHDFSFRFVNALRTVH